MTRTGPLPVEAIPYIVSGTITVDNDGTVPVTITDVQDALNTAGVELRNPSGSLGELAAGEHHELHLHRVKSPGTPSGRSGHEHGDG